MFGAGRPSISEAVEVLLKLRDVEVFLGRTVRPKEDR